MAAIGHVAVGIAVARARRWDWRHALAFSALALLPDVDVIAFVLRIPYSAPFGHRGATHSFAFAALCGLAAWAWRRDSKLAWLVGLTVATHPLLDALTDGGLGVACFWPVSDERFFFPWQPLPVAPIGQHMLSARGGFVVAVEALAFLPLWLYALWPRKGFQRQCRPGVPSKPPITDRH
ncbi:MAG: metal-dependent hydrolase [Myxococcales bacterium]|nr:metal-dependent hydrolase [Myxococcales bacterium]